MTTRPEAPRPIVVKLGGSTLGGHDTSLADIAVARREGRPLVVVHGGGATISAWLGRSGIPATFARGLRVTDAATLEIVVAVLAGVVNKQLVAELGALGAPAIGLSGADSLILQARRYDAELGFVGKVSRVNPYPVEELLRLGYLPVIAPIAIEVTHGAAPQLLNINADSAAGELAAALHAETLVFLTDVAGVLDASRAVIPRLSVDAARALIAGGIAAGGMIPKLEAAVCAAEAGAPSRVIDGRQGGALAAALSGEGAGTLVG
ncbi:MAG: acetylglutamate kinase [Dehalococcoidia bacterium]|nr:acetylglutamate kinase [Dehalococcoidia bacterium]